VALQIVLNVIKQLGHVDGERFEGDFVAIAKTKVDRGFLAGGLRLTRLKTPPFAEDLI
jgi:hypothetical protein